MEEQLSQEQIEQQCIFCQIAKGKVPSKKVFEDDKLTAVLDINPASVGHILLIPKKHISVMPQMDEDLIGHFGMVSKQLSSVLIKSLQVEGVSVFVANGAAAGQRAPHFMLHIIPRISGDDVGLQLPVIKLSSSDLNSVVERLSPGIKKFFDVDPSQFLSSSVSDKEVLKKEGDVSGGDEKKTKADDEGGSEKHVDSEDFGAKKEGGVDDSGKDSSGEEDNGEAEDDEGDGSVSLDDISRFLAGGK